MDQAYTILLLSDEEADLVVVDYILHGSLMPGCSVKRAEAADEAERLLATGDYDVCLVDAGQGNQRGLDFARRQRARDPNLPVILLTDGEDQALDKEVEACGAVDFLPKGRFHAFRLARTVRGAIERRALIERVRRLEQYDELTGLAKKDNLIHRLGQMEALGRRNRFRGALMLFRLWELEQIAQAFGPAAVDHVVVQMSQRLTGLVREADLIGRWDDQTFAVIAGNISDEAALETLAGKVKAALEEPLRLETSDVHMHVTAASVRWPGGRDETVHSLSAKVEARVAQPPLALVGTG